MSAFEERRDGPRSPRPNDGGVVDDRKAMDTHVTAFAESGIASPRRLAIVTPWFGPDLRGGAEQQAWQLATRFAARGHTVDVLTTCCRSFFDDWGINHLPAGPHDDAGGFTVMRFPVLPRDRERFDRFNARLLAISRSRLRPGVSPVSDKEGEIWAQENINSNALREYLRAHSNDYDAFIFLPYLYGTTLNCLPLVAARAWLQPCLHDEVYAYLPEVADAIHAAKGLLFISEGEAETAARLFGPSIWSKGVLVGAGVEFEHLDQRGEETRPILEEKRYVLFLGRRDPGKGIRFLLDAFAEFRRSRPESDLTLVLAGPGERDYGDKCARIIDLGSVSEPIKRSLLRGCLALCQPSTNESFSRVLFEAWYGGKPALVHGDCLATRIAVEKSGGGWIAASLDEWSRMLGVIDELPASRLQEIGTCGASFAKTASDWDIVISRYEESLDRFIEDGRKRVQGKTRPARAIHQLLPGLAYGDAISNEALFIRDELRRLGFGSEIFVHSADPRLQAECHSFAAMPMERSEALMYHHSIGSEVTAVAARYDRPKCLIYHNITPPEFVAPYRPDFARLLRNGREEMWSLAPAFPLSVGDSSYNAVELEIYGFRDPGVLPLPVDPATWAQQADPDLMSRLQDGTRNLLFVGRVAPNKRQHELVEAFSRYRRLDDARLILVGHCGRHDPYPDYVRTRIEQLGLERHVWLVGHCSTEELHAYYRSSHLFWSMSEHEGFGVPLIEAMWFDVPVLAFRSTAVPETLGAAGVMFDSKTDLVSLARLAFELASESERRREVILAQRLRRTKCTRNAARPLLHRLVEQLIGNTSSVTARQAAMAAGAHS
jgi:glycosyltransferase involved in cell wall biosynthesis